MNQFQLLQKKAIDKAKKGLWQEALELNKEILQERPQDLASLNRLGYCYLQVSDKKNAQATYLLVLEQDKRNTIALKYLDLLKKNVKIQQRAATGFDDFVEEPRKTKILALDRLAGPKVLEQLTVAAPCLLKTKGRYVCVTTQEGEYIGSLPEDVSRHLSGLIKTGNTYKCIIRSVSKQGCWVFIKEKVVSEVNKYTPSFIVQAKYSDVELDEEVIVSDIADLDADGIEAKEPELEEAEEEQMGEQLPPDILGTVGEV